MLAGALGNLAAIARLLKPQPPLWNPILLSSFINLSWIISQLFTLGFVVLPSVSPQSGYNSITLEIYLVLKGNLKRLNMVYEVHIAWPLLTMASSFLLSTS